MQNAPSTLRLKLASHVRACESEGNVILLDLRHSRYLGIGASVARSLASQVDGWPVMSERAGPSAPEADSAGVAPRLVSQGLLTAASGSLPITTTIERATTTLSADPESAEESIGARRIANFIMSATITAWWMRCRSLNAIAMAISARHHRIQMPRSASRDVMRDATAAYEKLRPLAFTARDKCLYDSLALVAFLASEGLVARWVIGVKSMPFGAHSWVQSGHTVLNDHHEYVGQFRPILVV